MQKNSVLNFKQFRRIFEEGETPEEGVQIKSIDVVINIFFEIYGILATRTGGYKDAVKDYQTIANSENDKRGELMVSTVNKIADLVVKRSPNLKEAVDEYKNSMEFLKQAYDKILTEDKNQLLNIKKKIKDMIISYLDSLVNNVQNTKLPEIEKKNESLEYLGDLLLEKDLYQKERIRIIKSILPLRAKTEELSNKSIFPEIKSIAKTSLKKYDEIIKTLQSDDIFDKKKRTERAEEVENSRFSAASIETELNSALSKIAIKYGVAKEVDDLIKKSLASLDKANNTLQEAEKKKALEDEKTKVEDSESKSDKKEEDPKKTVESYGWKELKDGEEKEVYYKKEDWDDSKSADKQKDQIAIGKIVKGSIDETKKEVKIYNESSKKTFTKSISDLLDKSEGDKYSETKITGEKEGEKKEENKEYKEVKEGDKNPEEIKSIKTKFNKILPKNSSLDETGDYDDKLKKSIPEVVKIMKSIGILEPSYKEDPSKISVEFQKYLDEYIKKVEQIREELPPKS
jgi:hypothetical protein